MSRRTPWRWTLALAFALGCAGVYDRPDAGSPVDAGNWHGCLADLERCLYSDACCLPARCVGGVCRQCLGPFEECSILVPCCDGLLCKENQCQPPCISAGSACASGDECCQGDACVSGVCAACLTTGKECAADEECCNGASCHNGHCAPRCRGLGGPCHLTTDCCGSLICNGNDRCG